MKELLQPIHYKQLMKKNPSSRMIKEQNYTLLFLKTLHVKHRQLYQKSIKFIIFEDNIYEFNIENESFEKIGKSEQLYEKIDKILMSYLQIYENYLNVVEKKENELYKRKISDNFLNKWFFLKSNISKVNRVLSRIEYVISMLNRSGFLHANLLLDEISSIARGCEYLQNKLDVMYNYFYSLKNEKMNKQIYFISIISSIFLPINLVVGFFGMNTQNLFFDKNPNATWYVVYIMLGFVMMIFSIVISLKIKKSLKFKQKLTKKSHTITCK